MRAQPRGNAHTTVVCLLIAVGLASAGCGADAGSGGGAEGAGAASSGVQHDSASSDAGYYSSSGGSDASGSSGGRGGWQDTAAGGSSSSGGDAASANSNGGGPGEEDNTPQTWVGKEGANPFATVDVGGGETLVLEKVRVAVRVEGLRVRTLIDHIYSNPHDKQLEGTFRYSLPTESSVSYYAMFGAESTTQPVFFGDGDQLKGATAEQVAAASPSAVAEGGKQLWGKLMQARVHENVAAQQAYELETEQKVDPGLVQQVAPNTFTARVFPIPAKGRSRVLIAYEQTLPRVPNGYEYAFALPKGDIDELDFTLVAFKKQGSALKSGKHVGKASAVIENDTAGAYIARKTLTSKSEGNTLVFQFDAAGTSEADVLAGTDPVLNKDYAVLRLRPNIKALDKPVAANANAVFVLDTSRSEHPKRFDLNMQLIDGILAQSAGIKQFNVLTFDAGARWLFSKWQTNDAAGRQAVKDAMKGVLLEGGTDFSAALRALAAPPFVADTAQQGGTPADVFVLSDGSITWGGRDVDAMLGRYLTTTPFEGRIFAYRTGLGSENLALYHKLTANGAIFNCDTQTALTACFTAHQNAGITLTKVELVADKQFSKAAEMTDLLVAGRQAMLYPGAHLTIAGTLQASGGALVRIHGTAQGKPVVHDIPVELMPSGELAPRAWAEIAVAQLFDSGGAQLRGLGMALSQHYMIPSSQAAFVVLENDKLYKHYALTEWATKFTGQALSGLINAAYAAGQKAFGTWARVHKLLQLWDPNVQLLKNHGAFIAGLAAAASGTDMELADSTLAIPLVKQADVVATYIAALGTDAAKLPATHVNEAERRRKQAKFGAAVRALSTATEVLPGDTEVARMTGYRLLSWGHLPEAAAQLFGVLEQRPLEPQSWRDLANAVRSDRPALAAVLFEAALAGKWHSKFKAITTVVREEYAMLLSALPTMSNPKLAPLLKARIEQWKLTVPTDKLRVTATWNTNNTDIDLWVTDPFGEKCFYSNKTLKSGGVLLDDLTQGFGPERFSAATSVPGKWTVQLHYYANNGNQLVSETYAQISIVVNAGTPGQSISHHNVVLPKVGDVVDVATVELK